MAWFLGQSLVFLLLAFALGLLVGWLVWGRSGPGSAEARGRHKVIPEPVKVAAEPAPEPEPRPVAAFIAEPDPEPVAEFIAEPEPEPEPVAEVVAEPEPAAEFIAEPEPELVPEPIAEPRSAPMAESLFDAELGQPADDLRRIEGIGPKISSVLAEAGVQTFTALADLNQVQLTEILAAGGVKFAPSLNTWSEQARLLADGNEEAFATLTSQLVAGRRNR